MQCCGKRSWLTHARPFHVLCESFTQTITQDIALKGLSEQLEAHCGLHVPISPCIGFEQLGANCLVIDTKLPANNACVQTPIKLHVTLKEMANRDRQLLPIFVFVFFIF